MIEVKDLSDGILDTHLSDVVFEVNMIGSNLKEWWMNTGATHHIFSDKRMFISYNEVKNEEQL